MKTGQHNRKTGALLVLLLFAVFAVCILSVLLTVRDQNSYDLRTASQYLTTRVRQSDRLDSLRVSTFGGSDALVFTQEIDGKTYETLVYCWDGYLRELFAAADSRLLPEDGEKVLPAESLTLRSEGRLLTAELVTPSGETQRLTLYLRSGEGASA